MKEYEKEIFLLGLRRLPASSVRYTTFINYDYIRPSSLNITVTNIIKNVNGRNLYKMICNRIPNHPGTSNDNLSKVLLSLSCHNRAAHNEHNEQTHLSMTWEWGLRD